MRTPVSLRRPAPRRAIAGAALAAWLAAVPAVRAAELYVVVNAANPLRQVSQRDVVALYTGRARRFPGGEPARALDQAPDSATRAAFYRALTGMDLARINSFWARLRFTGRVPPPQTLADDTTVAEHVKRHANAIGYLSSAPSDPALRVVLVLTVAR